MAYVQRVLQPDEAVRHTGTLHWVIYVPGLTLLTIGGVCVMTIAEGGTPSTLVVIGFLLGVLIGPVALIKAWIRQATTEIIVTDRRVLLKTGWLRRNTIEMNMNKVESVDVAQGITGRMLNYGTVIVRGAGASIEPLASVAAPVELRNCITVA
jgi:uncharacterized membrane protein YdbT with pleckstrin-like domain